MPTPGTRRQSKWDPRSSRQPADSDKVLTAALRLFDLAGYSATTIADIKLQSEVSVGAIYHYFGSKEGIAGALYVRSLHDFQRCLVRALFGERRAEGGVKAAVRAHLRWVDANRAQARFLLRRRETEVVDVNAADVRALNARFFDEVETWYRPHVAAQAIRDLDRPLLFAVWFGPAQEYSRQALESAAESPLEAEPALADAAWGALRPA